MNERDDDPGDVVPEGYWDHLDDLLDGRTLKSHAARLAKARELVGRLRKESFCASHRFKLDTCRVFHELCDVLGIEDGEDT